MDKSIDFIRVHPENIELIFSAFDSLKDSNINEVKTEHSENIYSIFVTWEISNEIKLSDSNLLQLLNI